MPSKVSIFPGPPFLMEAQAPFEVAISPKRRLWEWCVRDRSGKVIMTGRETARARARYQSARLIFALADRTRASVNGIFGYGDRATESRGMPRSVCDVSSQVGRRAELAIAVRSAMIGEQL